MKLATLNIDRFGARTNLNLTDFSDQLNVVFGPNGSGKTTIFNFLSWVLYGNLRGSHSRYLSDLTNRASGTLEVTVKNYDRLAVTRNDDGTPSGRLSVQDAHRSTAFDNRQLTGVDAEEFRHIFAISFDDLPTIERLIHIASSRGFDFTYDEEQVRYVQELEARLVRERAELGTHPETEERLNERRQSIHRQIESIEQQIRTRIAENDRQRSSLLGELHEKKAELQRLQGWLGQVDATIQDRRIQLETIARDVENARNTWIESRKKKVAEIDYQLEHWHRVMDTIRSRANKLRTRLAKIEPATTYAPVDDDSDVHLFMRSLGYQVEDIERDFMPPYDLNDGGELSEEDYYRRIYGTALASMRDDVHRLASELRGYKASAQQSEYESEIGHLRRIEAELTELVDSLSKRRDTLMSQPEARQPSTRTPLESPVSDRWNNRDFHAEGNGRQNGHYRLSSDDSLIRPWYEARELPVSGEIVREFTDTSTWARGVDPVLEARLQHLVSRRHQITPQLHQLESQVKALESRLQHLQQPIADDHRVEQLRQELVRIDEQMRFAATYRRRMQEIKNLEEELHRLRSGMNPSGLLREAAVFLGKLTEGSLTKLCIDSAHQVSVEDTTGRRIRYHELSRGGRDQCYLALCLALVTAYHQRGVEHPFVLNDLFVNIDSNRAAATVDVLQHIAASGQQVVLLTRHDHVAQMFSKGNNRFFSLESRHWQSDTAPPRPRPIQPTPVRTYDSTMYNPAAYDSPTIPEPVLPKREMPKREMVADTRYEWVTKWEQPRAAMANPVSETVVPYTPSNREPTPPAERSLSLNSALNVVETIDPEFIRWFQTIDVRTIADFLRIDANEAASLLSEHQLAASQVYRWQSELLLQVHVGIAAVASQILVDCGIDDPEELAANQTDDLYRRIHGYVSDARVHQRYTSLPHFDRTTISRWIERAQRSSYKRRNQRFVASAAESRVDRSRVPLETVERHEPVSASVVAEKTADVKPRSVRRRTSSNRTNQRTRSTRSSKTTKSSTSKSEKGLKFHLELSDPIVDAPSIGPKTAERFEAIGVTKIAEFFEIDPEVAAEKIAYQRISVEIISEWQLQSKLVHQIPNLRGHDAQILVACDVNSPSDLARADASTLFKEVDKFCNTTEGKRILRNGKKPDMEEVESWIEWSQNARELLAS